MGFVQKRKICLHGYSDMDTHTVELTLTISKKKIVYMGTLIWTHTQ
jgi:hypothetical protein